MENNNNNNTLNTNHVDEQNIATVDNTQTRSIHRPLIPSSSQNVSPNFPNRQREPLNNTGSLDNSYTTYHQRSESTRLPDTERRHQNNPRMSRINEDLRNIYERHGQNNINTSNQEQPNRNVERRTNLVNRQTVERPNHPNRQNINRVDVETLEQMERRHEEKKEG